MFVQDFHSSPSPRMGRASPGPKIELCAGLTFPGFVMDFAPNEEIFGQEEDVDFLYKVESGATRTTRLLSDGRRQIDGFHLSGDIFGLENGPRHRFSAEAVTPCRIALVRRSAVEAAARRDLTAAHRLWALSASQVEQLQERMIVLSRKNAAERVGAFLLELSRRLGSRDLELPMSRADIADYLGLTLETVSRTFSQFARDGVVSLQGARRLAIRSPQALSAS